jgi:hypothetical protein
VPGRWGWHESARVDRPWETTGGPQDRRKALKGEAQERGKLKKAFEGGRADTVERVVKPCGRDFWKAWHGFSNARRELGEKKGSSVWTC